MIWIRTTSKVMPKAVDMAISKKWVYIRKNIESFKIKDIFTGEIETYYSYDECKIPKEIYAVFEQEKDNSSRLDDVEEVITEILGGEI